MGLVPYVPLGLGSIAKSFRVMVFGLFGFGKRRELLEFEERDNPTGHALERPFSAEGADEPADLGE